MNQSRMVEDLHGAMCPGSATPAAAVPLMLQVLLASFAKPAASARPGAPLHAMIVP